MTNLVLVGALFGLVLGRFFKVYVLVPACILASVLALTGPNLIAGFLSTSCIELVVLIASLQFGYAVGLLSNQLSGLLSGRRGTPTHAMSSRTLHVR